MKRIRKLAKPNAYAATVSRHIRRLSSGSAGASNRRSGVQVPVPEDASVASATSISMNSSCNTDVSDFDGIGNDGDAPQDGEEEQVFLQRQKGRGSSPLPQASQSLCLHVIEEQRSIDVPQLCQAWVDNANALMHSHEMRIFLSSTKDVALGLTGIVVHGAGVAVHVACLPVTLPIHLITSATETLLLTCTQVVSVVAMQNNQHRLLPVDAQPHDTDTSSQSSPIDSLVHHVSNAVPAVLHAADGIKNSIGGILLGLFSPLLGEPPPSTNQTHRQEQYRHPDSSSAGESSSEKETFLDRLRIDPATGDVQQRVRKASSSDVSKSLLRVSDLNIHTDSGDTLFYIDLSPDFANEQLSSKGLEALLKEGLALASMGTDYAQSHGIDMTKWKPEGETRKLLKIKETMTDAAAYLLLEQHALVWSGTFKSGRYRDLDAPLFLSRGVVPGSPREIFELLCDSSRTTEYNRFCLGRSDLLVIQDDNTSNPEERVKVIKVVKSETRVPFTSLSVTMSTLMYGLQLDDEEDANGDVERECFIIVSRSLTSGVAGYHCDCNRVERDVKNEITWGVNLMRSVPQNPKVTDLVNMSQVNSSFVPRFLTHRVGMMAVENSFNALRTRDV